MRTGRVLAAVVISGALLAVLAGCQSTLPSGAGFEDVARVRKDRRADSRAEFEYHRDRAEFQAALECYRRKDLPGCRKALKPLLKRNPEHIEGQLLLAETLVAQDRCQEAISGLEPLAGRHPDHAQLQHAMGLLWDNAGDTERALDYYRRAARREPSNREYQLSYNTAAQAATNASLASVLDEPAADPAGGREVEWVGHDESAGERVFAGVGGAARAISATRPRESDPRLGPLIEALGGGSVDQALSLLEKAMAANPQDPQIPISAAVAALERNRQDVAIALVKPGLERFPQSACLYRILAAAHYRSGQYDASQIALQQALSLDNSSALSYFIMGCTLTRLGQTEAAAESFRRAREIDPRFVVRQ